MLAVFRFLFYICSDKKIKLLSMATNKPYEDDHRNGAVKNRSQVFNGKIDRFVKRDTASGKFMDVKSDGKPFKGVNKEK